MMLSDRGRGAFRPCYKWSLDQSDRQTIVKEIFESTLSRAEVESHLQRALDQTYWQRLNPDLSIGERRSATELEAASLDELQTAVQMDKLRREGYFQTAPALHPDVVRRMRLAVEKLREEHWPAVFSCVYAEFWQIL